MLRDARQVAINQVVEALLEAAHVHQQGAELLDDPRLAAALRALAEQRGAAALELGDHVRQLGDLPSEPDADLQAARDVLARLQMAVADDPHGQVLERCGHAEAHLARLVKAALEMELPSDTREALERLLSAPELRAAFGSG